MFLTTREVSPGSSSLKAVNSVDTVEAEVLEEGVPCSEEEEDGHRVSSV